MKFTEEKHGHINVIQQYTPSHVRIGGKDYGQSLMLGHDWLILLPQLHAFSQVDDNLLENFFTQGCELIILGTGQHQAWLPPAMHSGLVARGMGVETMANASAIRTFNLLAGDGRKVGLLLIFAD